MLLSNSVVALSRGYCFGTMFVLSSLEIRWKHAEPLLELYQSILRAFSPHLARLEISIPGTKGVILINYMSNAQRYESYMLLL
jgi:hypothetical protein